MFYNPLMGNAVTHNMKTWFKETGMTPRKWFETIYEGNKLGRFVIPASYAKYFNTEEKLDALFNAIGKSYIDLLVKLKTKLKSIPFSMLEEDDQLAAREYVCGRIQFAVKNNQIIQIVQAATISTGAWTIGQDTTPWGPFTSDMLDTNGNVDMQNINIDEYEIVMQDVLFTETLKGNYKILRQIDLADVPAIVWDTI